MSSKLWRAMREIIHLRKRACTQCDGNKSLLSISVGNYTAEYKYTYIYIYTRNISAEVKVLFTSREGIDQPTARNATTELHFSTRKSTMGARARNATQRNAMLCARDIKLPLRVRPLSLWVSGTIERKSTVLEIGKHGNLLF